MAAGPVFLSMRPARRCPHGFPLLMHTGLLKLTGINGENAPLASRLTEVTEAQFRGWGRFPLDPDLYGLCKSKVGQDRR